jgi:hypothetical protein
VFAGDPVILHTAAEANVDILKDLIEAGADVEAKEFFQVRLRFKSRLW